VTIDRDEHFFDRNTLLACTTAPIFNERGELAATLDISSFRADLTQGFVKLIATAVSDAARTVEAENFRLAFRQARILLATAADRGGPALLAVDRDDLVVGATRAARLALGFNSAALEWPIPAADLIGRKAKSDDIDAAERLQRPLARAGGNVSQAAKNLNLSRATLHRKTNQLGLRG
jgi:transcriptional regulator of acetoin/glycerol metabolism